MRPKNKKLAEAGHRWLIGDILPQRFPEKTLWKQNLQQLPPVVSMKCWRPLILGKTKCFHVNPVTTPISFRSSDLRVFLIQYPQPRSCPRNQTWNLTLLDLSGEKESMELQNLLEVYIETKSVNLKFLKTRSYKKKWWMHLLKTKITRRGRLLGTIRDQILQDSPVFPFSCCASGKPNKNIYSGFHGVSPRLETEGMFVE